MTLLMRSDEMDRSVRYIQEIIDAASLNETNWQAVCEAICSLLPDIKTAIQVRFSHNSDAIPIAASGYDQSDIDDYLSYFGKINPWSPGWLSAASNIPFCSREFLSNRSLFRTEFYNDWLRSVGNADAGSGLKFMHKSDRVGSIDINYSIKKNNQYHECLEKILARINTSLQFALSQNELIARAATISPSLSESPLLERLIDPAFLVTSKRKIVKANEAAVRFIGGHTAIAVEANDVVRFFNQDAERKFDTIVKEACSIATRNIDACQFTFVSGDDRLNVSALPVMENLRSLAFNGSDLLFVPATLALIIIRTKTINRNDIEYLLKMHYRLTNMESILAFELSYGGNLVETSNRLDISYSTARAHMRSIYNKLGINKQRDLIDIISGFYLI